MTSAAKSFILSEADLNRGVFRKIKAKAKEENVTIAQYLAGMLHPVSIHLSGLQTRQGEVSSLLIVD
ncbi:MAG: hypothetical protein LBJ94_03680 [Puniceicoccales bacterium]|jgi:hypothetical protein|nr:hypothetical protein [Puniceicoccales bacterium]